MSNEKYLDDSMAKNIQALQAAKQSGQNVDKVANDQKAKVSSK